MGLIDADKLIEDIHKRNYISKALSEIFETIIDEQPSAYDVDKIVQQLGNLNKYNLNLADAMLDIQANGINRHFICLEDAIEIVKAGVNA